MHNRGIVCAKQGYQVECQSERLMSWSYGLFRCFSAKENIECTCKSVYMCSCSIKCHLLLGWKLYVQKNGMFYVVYAPYILIPFCAPLMCRFSIGNWVVSIDLDLFFMQH